VIAAVHFLCYDSISVQDIFVVAAASTVIVASILHLIIQDEVAYRFCNRLSVNGDR